MPLAPPPSIFRSGPPAPDDADLQRQWQAYRATPGPATAGPVLQSLQGTIDSGVRAFGGGSSQNANLKSRARILTLDALDSYDPARGQLPSHVMNHLRGLSRYAVKQQQTVTAPERIMLDHKRLADASRDLTDELGRAPSDSELADHTGLPLKRISQVRSAKLGVTQGQMQAGMATGDDDDGPGDIAVEQADPTRRLAEFLYHDVDDVDRVILEHRLGLGGKPILAPSAIAGRLNLSPARVSQRAQRLAQQLEELRQAGL